MDNQSQCEQFRGSDCKTDIINLSGCTTAAIKRPAIGFHDFASSSRKRLVLFIGNQNDVEGRLYFVETNKGDFFLSQFLTEIAKVDQHVEFVPHRLFSGTS